MSDARRAFPVFDEPEYKIPFTVTVSAPDGLKAYANTPETSQSSEEGWTTREFAQTPPIPTYLVTLAVGPDYGAHLAPSARVPHGSAGAATAVGRPPARTPITPDR
jgi:hypothetical protein